MHFPTFHSVSSGILNSQGGITLATFVGVRGVGNGPAITFA